MLGKLKRKKRGQLSLIKNSKILRRGSFKTDAPRYLSRKQRRGDLQAAAVTSSRQAIIEKTFKFHHRRIVFTLKGAKIFTSVCFLPFL